MRIKASDPKAAEIFVVLVDGKRVPFPIEIDTDEGWVLAAIPVIPKSIEEVEVVNPDTDDPNATGEAQWIEKKLEGKVEVIWYDQKN